MIFTIPAGQHRSRPRRLAIYFRRSAWEWDCMFGKGCLYDLKTDDQLDWNKLVGVGFLPGHHQYSVRVGWRCVGRQIELALYAYQEGKRITIPLTVVQVHQAFRVRIYQTGRIRGVQIYDYYGTLIGHQTIDVQKWRWWAWGLWPYFGGNKAAPQDMTITLSKR